MMTGAMLPVLRVESLTDALDATALSGIAPEALERFLHERRWFGAKGRRASSVRIGDVVGIEHEGYRAAVARVEVVFGGDRHVYQLPLAVRAEGADFDVPKAVLARIEARDTRGVLFDATEDAAFRGVVASSFARGRAFGGRGARWVIEPLASDAASAAPRLDAGTPSKVSSGEQSNTSIIYGDAAILKLFRRLEAGENPDVEIGRFLTTRTGYRNTPALLGTIHFEADSGERIVAGMLQSFVAGSTDAWRDTLQRARPWIASADDETLHDSVRDAEELGRVTRELHDALASDAIEPDFSPQPATADDIARWAEATRRSIDAAVSLLADRIDAGAVHDSTAGEARVVVDRRTALQESVAEHAAALAHDAGERIRHHGDYHLGQVLRAPDGTFMIIDFEGEPARSIAERRQRTSALRDVAGMLRSFAYAASTLATEERKSNGVSPELDRRAERWEHDVRGAYLRGYLHEPLPHYLPAARENIDALLSLFETEKVFYELAYELNNRPDWVWIPVHGITRLLSTHATHAAERR